MQAHALYWHIEKWDGEIIRVKPTPENIEYIQELMSKGVGSIITPTRSINIKDVKEFRESDERYIDQKLLEGAAQAFNEAQETEDGIKSKWVKKSVPRRTWNSLYRLSPGYRVLEDQDSYVLIAFRLPVHLIDYQKVQDLTDKELINLNETRS